MSLAQYEAGITEAPNSEVPCLVLYTKLMSELILEKQPHILACAQVSILSPLTCQSKLALSSMERLRYKKLKDTPYIDPKEKASYVLFMIICIWYIKCVRI